MDRDPEINPTIRSAIEAELAAIEAENEVRILFAIESGSRAWGFASPDSDYDVRFVYAHPRDAYLTIEPMPSDTINPPVGEVLDFAGWDIRKALALFAKSNPSLLEWTQSPIRYRDDGVFLRKLQEMVSPIFSTKAGIYHYHSMMVSNHALLGTGQVKLKRYFYILRPLLACKWIAEYRTVPPIEFADLLPMLEPDPAVADAIQDLLAIKRNTPELGLGPSIPVLDEYIQRHLTQWPVGASAQAPEVDIEILNQLFRATIT